MNKQDAYDILTHCLKYKYQFRNNNPVVTFEYVLDENQINDLLECVHIMNIPHTKIKESSYKINFIGCEILINYNFPI